LACLLFSFELMRILHFVTGGFSGATQVAIDLCLAAQRTPGTHTLLVLRRKRNTSAARVQALRDQGLDVRVVSNWLHALTVWELRRIIRSWQPDAVFAHGFSDHIWGRQAAVAEGVPRIFHVEHNSRERYTPQRLRQALALAPFTQASIGVSEGVRQALIERGFPPERCIAILNGIALEKFPDSLLPAHWQEREPAILMAARFGRQKDHATLLRALALLKAQGLQPRLYLAGAGSTRLRKQMERLAHTLGLHEQVVFLGNVSNLPERLARVQICVLASHWEGLGLSMMEGMAAGCACIGSKVVGLQEVIQHQTDGLLVPPADPGALAYALAQLLTQPDHAAQLGAQARATALAHYGRKQMAQRYQALLDIPLLPATKPTT